MLAFELSYWKDCPAGVLAGIDEAGRGPLAGPVAAAAVVMNLATADAGFKGPWRGLTDSKKLSEKAREPRFFVASMATICPRFRSPLTA